MTDPLLWLGLVTLVLAAYFSSLHLSLVGVRLSLLERWFERRGRPGGETWIAEHVSSAVLATALVRTIVRLAFFVIVLIEVVGMDEDAPLTWTGLAVAAVISVPLLWIATSVVSVAVARHAETGLLARSVPLLQVCVAVCTPLTWAVGFIDEAVRRLSGANLRDDEEAEAELLRSVEETQREGNLDESAAAMIENVVDFSRTDAAEIMTPRTDIEGIELTDDLTTIRQFILEAGHSRIPVYRENLDDIAGILYVKDLIPYLGEDGSGFRLEPVLRRPLLVPETKLVPDLLGDFQQAEVHLAIVVDEYGGTAGLVTIEDVLEEIVGEIHDEHEPEDDEHPSLERVDADRAEVDGRFYIDDLNEQLGLDLPEDEDYDTVGGFMLASLGRVPEVGATVETDDARFTALITSPTRIERVGVELLGPLPGVAASNGSAK